MAPFCRGCPFNWNNLVKYWDEWYWRQENRRIPSQHPRTSVWINDLGVCNNLQPKWRKAWIGEGNALVFFPLPHWDQPFHIFGICKLPRCSLAVFSPCKAKPDPPYLHFFLPSAWYHQLLAFRTQFFCHLHKWLQCFGQFYMDGE